MSSSFSIVDDNDKIKYKLSSVPIFENSQSSWNNSTKTNAFNIHTVNQTVLFTGNFSCVKYNPIKLSAYYKGWVPNYNGTGQPGDNALYMSIYPGGDVPLVNPLQNLHLLGLYIISDYFNIGTYLSGYTEATDPVESRKWNTSQAPKMPFGGYSETYDIFITDNIDKYNNYINNPEPPPLQITIRFNLKGTTNYIYQNLNFPYSDSRPIIPINFVKTFTDMGLYDINIYLNDDYITDSNDFLNLNATLYDLIIPPEEDNFEL